MGWALEGTFGRLFATQVDRDTVVAYLNRRMKEGAGLSHGIVNSGS